MFNGRLKLKLHIEWTNIPILRPSTYIYCSKIRYNHEIKKILKPNLLHFLKSFLLFEFALFQVLLLLGQHLLLVDDPGTGSGRSRFRVGEFKQTQSGDFQTLVAGEPDRDLPVGRDFLYLCFVIPATKIKPFSEKSDQDLGYLEFQDNFCSLNPR